MTPTSTSVPPPGPRPVRLSTLDASRGVRLQTYEWLPDGAPKGLIAYAHGYGEHAMRHERPIARLVAAGYQVLALDHRGHGMSEGERATCRRFDDYTDDYAALIGRARNRYPGLPLFALGYSMGGLIALRYALRDEHQDLAGLILASAALDPISLVPGPARPLAKRAVRLLAKIAPNLPVTPPCEDRCRPDTDPLCYSGPTPARLADQLLRAGDDASGRLGALTCPLLVMHGTGDWTTSPKGSERIHTEASSADKTLHLFPGFRHPILTRAHSPALGILVPWLEAHSAPASVVNLDPRRRGHLTPRTGLSPALAA